MMAATCSQSQLSCFSSFNRKLQFQRRSICHPGILSSKSWVCTSLEDQGMNTASSEIKTTLSYTADEMKPYVKGTTESYPITSEKHSSEEIGKKEQVPEGGVSQPKKTTKIHDFCFGIPYVLSAALKQNFESLLIGGNSPLKKLKSSAAAPS